VRSVTLIIVGLVVGLMGCPPAAEKKEIGACKKVGDSCELSPGKLGTCVSIDTCDKPPCGFACQSQH
jgi:hypothetical protein